MDERNRSIPVRRRLSLNQDVLGGLIPSGPELTLEMKARNLEVLSKQSVFHLCFVHYFKRMSTSNKLSNCFHAAGTNGRLDLSFPWCASCCRTNCSCCTWSRSWTARFAKKSVASNRRSSAGWIPARTDKSSVGVRREHPVTIRKASLRMLSMRQVCVLRHQTGAQYSAVE